jgi:hypothetical protein
MIDPLAEELITPTAATQLYPRGPKGKKVHVARVYRDMLHGSHGVVLEHVRTPRLATSREAVARFFARLTRALGSERDGSAEPTPTRPDARDVDRQLDALGL